MLAFVHIPKTAGTTLHKILSHQYPRVFIHHDTEGPPCSALADRIRERNPQVIMGHFSVGLHEFLPDLRYITCLREPVSRLVSHYHHAHNDPAHYLHQAVVSRNLDLANYVSSGLSGELSNGMTRMLAGVTDFHGATVDQTDLTRAKSNLDTLFDAVIPSEHFDAGLLLAAMDLDWKTPYYLRRKVGRYASTTPTPDPHTRSVIESHNRLDCELYSWAKQRFEIRTAFIPDLAEQTRRFQQANRLKGKAIFCLRELWQRLS